MSTIKIKTLTPVHIGSGETLIYGNDFVNGTDEDGYLALGIISPEKVLSIIGVDNLSKWVSSIERGNSTDEILKSFGKDVPISDYCSRILGLYADVKPSDTLRELLHDGLGHSYIPGSSIKGAIRTAIFSSIINNSNIDNMCGKVVDRNGYKMKVHASILERIIFGSDPNTDVFRFLKISDAIFDNDYNIALRMVNINERMKQSFWDKSKSQLIEALDAGEETNFNLKIDNTAYEFSKSRVHSLPECMSTLTKLFNTINKHTESLVNSEIEYWGERAEQDDSDRVLEYIEKMKSILSIIHRTSKTNGTECVLRVGYGSGWKFITGGWSEQLDNFESVIVPAARPNNGRYQEYSFPKSRRVSDEMEILGFVKLSIVK